MPLALFSTLFVGARTCQVEGSLNEIRSGRSQPKVRLRYQQIFQMLSTLHGF